METRKCPICDTNYNEIPAISRKDNSTIICPDCGTKESLEVIGFLIEEQQKAIEKSNQIKNS